jgi:hypothetical protein
MTFPTRAGLARTEFDADSTFVATVPAAVSGELLLAIFVEVGAVDAMTVSGWQTVFTSSATVGGSRRLNVYRKISDGTETDVSAVLTGTPRDGEAIVMRFQNWSGSLADIVAGSAVNNTSNANPPTLTPGYTDDTMWWAIAGGTSTASASAYPTNYADNQETYLGSAGTSVGIAIASRNLNTATQDPGAFTWAAVTMANTLAIRGGSAGAPAAGGQAVRSMHQMRLRHVS